MKHQKQAELCPTTASACSAAVWECSHSQTYRDEEDRHFRGETVTVRKERRP